MSGFFRGPSLLTHVLIVATISAIAVPQVHDRAGSWAAAGMVWIAFVALYAVGAVLHGSR